MTPQSLNRSPLRKRVQENIELPAHHLGVIGGLGIFFEQLLIRFEGAFILAADLVTTRENIFRLRRGIGQRPIEHDAVGGFFGEAVIRLVEGGFGK